MSHLIERVCSHRTAPPLSRSLLNMVSSDEANRGTARIAESLLPQREPHRGLRVQSRRVEHDGLILRVLAELRLVPVGHRREQGRDSNGKGPQVNPTPTPHDF